MWTEGLNKEYLSENLNDKECCLHYLQNICFRFSVGQVEELESLPSAK